MVVVEPETGVKNQRKRMSQNFSHAARAMNAHAAPYAMPLLE